jgi:hypothetical protein
MKELRARGDAALEDECLGEGGLTATAIATWMVCGGWQMRIAKVVVAHGPTHLAAYGRRNGCQDYSMTHVGRLAMSRPNLHHHEETCQKLACVFHVATRFHQ